MADRECSADIWNYILRIGSKINPRQGVKNFSETYRWVEKLRRFLRVPIVLILVIPKLFRPAELVPSASPTRLHFLAGCTDIDQKSTCHEGKTNDICINQHGWQNAENW
ncbi:hypothetical protein [Halocynthiibacter namhaensis]|uniref:hypothetical protein n=1 Tax=Halocynthiibacter namhaensis TaxID=1290553 RepID=UPI00138DE7C8|nr:hypothetical protein [Halocynthiibacter namhaensis]